MSRLGRAEQLGGALQAPGHEPPEPSLFANGTT
jgi:hypothetical protein